MKKNILQDLHDNLEEIITFVSKGYCEVWSTEYPPHKIIEPDAAFNSKSLHAIKGKDSIWLYIHFPFCTMACDFCSYFRPNKLNKNTTDQYISSIINEIETLFKTTEKKQKVSGIYLGGGTPTLVTEKDFLKLFNFLQTFFLFEKDIQIITETTPHQITDQYAKTLKKCGVNRVSIGVQSFNEENLLSIKRPQKNSSVYQAVKALKNARIENINLDLIFGLTESETSSSFLEDNLEHIKILAPTSVYIYALQNYSKHKEYIYNNGHIEVTALLKKEIEQQTSIIAIDALSLKGDLNSPIQNINKYFYDRRVKLKNVIGVGCGANSHLWNNGQYCNTRMKNFNFQKYITSPSNTIKYISKTLNEDESLRKYIIKRLATNINVDIVLEKFPNSEEKFYKIIQPILPALEIKNNNIHLSKNFDKHCVFKTQNKIINYFIFTFQFLYSANMQQKLLNKVLPRS